MALVAGSASVKGTSVATISESGLILRSLGLGPIPWREISSVRIETNGDGGAVLCLTLKDEAPYLRQMPLLRRVAAFLRRTMGYSSFAIYALGSKPESEAIIAEIQRRILADRGA
ncbi:MAG: hypothetical protein JSS86_19025 [Cyanobacteria bacterium SZAS LIN-2]|nr:hypothetical protein [Cyanobacteria bacterium SZAS LIN-2]